MDATTHRHAHPVTRTKQCPCCGRATRHLHRIRLDPTGGWKAGCSLCVAAVLHQNELATYGGIASRWPTPRRRKAG